jgi:hypothetical protein
MALKLSVPAAVLLLLAVPAFAAQSPATLNNDDSCDIIVAPAATLLLPYFEVDPASPLGETTLFTVTNVTQVPRIARVTIWTDWSFPLFSFNIFLTGYDVQSINLYDVIVRGSVPDPAVAKNGDVGHRSLGNDVNPLLDVASCDAMPVGIPPAFFADLRTALVTGRSTGCPNDLVGGHHVNAVGYVTIDVVRSCSHSLPTDPGYFSGEVLYDNVLSGDYQQVNSSQNFAQGGAMVHIRAIPEGGPPGAQRTNFVRTFYSNYQNGGTADRRQPLPSTFAARWISGGGSQFGTSFKIWREGASHAGTGCAVSGNAHLEVVEIVRFDEQENLSVFSDCEICAPIAPPTLPASSRFHESNSLVFPPAPDESIAGWMYMNFDHDDGSLFLRPASMASQNWVVVSMEAAGRYSADFDAASLDNGCTPAAAVTDRDGGEPAIGPAPNDVNGVFAGSSPGTTNNDDSCDVKVTPAATLLLPYFEVDLDDPAGETTLFTVTNVTPLPRIARLTIWTDWAFPLLSLNVFLTGYDAQSINLYDVIARGRVAEPGTSSDTAPGRRSGDNDANPLLDLSNCGNLVDRIPASILVDLQSALTFGLPSSCATTRVGGTHSHAKGYLTVDVVQNCQSRLPTDPGYFTRDVLFDNVLIGDYQQVNSSQNFAQANAMVHIRAIPEGGPAGSTTTTTRFRRTFYSRLQAGGTADRRQPLPSAFAARWISGGPSGFQTSFKIWREGVTGAEAGCAVFANAIMDVPDLVRFDEEENPTIVEDGCSVLCPVFSNALPATVRIDASTYVFPSNPDGAVAGWMYLNLDNYAFGHSPADTIAQQAWVVVSMAAEGRYSVDFDATALGNGCSPAVAMTDEEGHLPVIGPAPNVNPGM